MPTDLTLAAECVNAPAGYDNIASSIRIAHTESIDRAYGHWISYTGTESVSFELHQGFSTTDENGTARESEYKLGVEMKTGFDFGIENKEKISFEYSEEIRKDTKTAYEMDIDKTVHVNCDDAKGTSDGVGLWQWVVSSSD